MKAIHTGATLLSALLLAGCAVPYTPVPLATNFPTTLQETVRASAHWNMIATDLEQRLAQDMKAGPKRPVYLAEPKEASPFQRALTSLVATALVRDGYVVARAPAGALRIDIDLQALTFGAKRYQYAFQSEVVTLGKGVWVRPRVDLSPGAAPGAFVRDPLPDSLSRYADGPTPQTEIIVTLSVSDQYRYYARTAATYYVADADVAMYGIVVKDQRQEQTIQEARNMKQYQVRGDR